MSHSDAVVREFLSLINALRLEQNLTHEQLSEMAGIHRTTIGLLARQERIPSLHVAYQIAEALGYPLSELLLRSEMAASVSRTTELGKASLDKFKKRKVSRANIRNEDALLTLTGLDAACLIEAIESCYHTLDIIDEQLISRKSPVVEELVELANLSSMVGNLLSAGIAVASGGLYQRNRPHAYPDLLPVRKPAVELELKMALETNKPKGHLPKGGTYLTIRYVLGNTDGTYIRGKENRGATVWLWEVKVGRLKPTDFTISNTAGDSGKTAVIATEIFNKMPLVYYDPNYLPHKPKAKGIYPGYN